jgi:hypothetical protein
MYQEIQSVKVEALVSKKKKKKKKVNAKQERDYRKNIKS